MTSFPTAYTPLETLLLFQALRSEGVNSYSVFNRISDQLKSIHLVKSDPSYDSGRLSPDALRELYLWLLKDEVKRDNEGEHERHSLLQNGDVSPGSRKRKAPSPSLPTVQEASKHAHLIPQLVMRLYGRYREHTVREIREHERRYDALARDIEEIEAGKWDERLQRQRTTSATASPRPPSTVYAQAQSNRQDHVRSAKSTTASPIPGTAPPPSKPYTANKIDALINHGPEPQNGASNHRRTSSNTTLPPLSEMAPRSPHFGIPPTIPPKQQPQIQSPTHTQQSPFASHHGHPMPGSMASPQVQNSLSRPSSSPRPILPPPPGMTMPPQSPLQPLGSPGPHLPQPPSQYNYIANPGHHRLSTGASPIGERPPGPYAQYQQPTTPQGYYQPPQYVDRRASYPVQQQHQQYASSTYPSQQAPAAGYQPHPYQNDYVDSANGRSSQPMQQARLPHESTSHGQRPSYPPYPPNAPSTAPKPVRPGDPRLVTDIIAKLGTPPRGQRSPLWKSERRPPPVKIGTPVPRPDPEPLSPVMKRSEPAARSTRATRNGDPSIAEPSTELEPPKTNRGRGRSKRERSPHSVVSSTADDSARMTRSQSVSTAAGAIPTSDDRPGSRGNFKVEPSTPAGFVDEMDVTHEVPSGGRMTRKRRGTLQSQPQQSQRKRQRSTSGNRESEDADVPPPRSSTVTATRNFNKLCATIMNDINSHKHASYFANAVRDKDAPGYSEIIKQPQNLKSIRAAITAGTKAVNAAASALESPSALLSGADGSTIVELERNADIIPPKAIVNAAQLEKEVLRTFANAVMFNPGEDGMVSDTREMCEDVDTKMQEWKGVERDGGVVEEIVEDETKQKRRKL